MVESPILRMPVTTRGYELAASGVLPPSAYLRYLEHIRWQTFATDGPIPVRRFWSLGVVRAQSLEIFSDASFHAELSLSLWVSRVGRTSFDFSHAIERVADGETIALATATVVALDENRRPKVIAEEAKNYVVERRTTEVPRPVDPAPGAWSCPVVVRPSDHDLQQHVNHARYADFVEDARLLCSRAGGYGEAFEAPVRKLRLEYEREARFGMQLRMVTSRVPDTERDLTFRLEDDAGTVLLRARQTIA